MVLGLGRLQISFRVTGAEVWFRNSPTVQLDDLANAPDPSSCWPFLSLTLDPDHHLFSFLAGNRATAKIFRHSTGEEKARAGFQVRGEMCIGQVQEEAGVPRRFVELAVFLTPPSFDSLVSALAVGGQDFVQRCKLVVGFLEHRDKIKFTIPPGEWNQSFLLDDILMGLEIGDKPQS